MNKTGPSNKIKTREQVEEIWLADSRLKNLADQWFEAVLEGNAEKVHSIQNMCTHIRGSILTKYDVALDGPNWIG